MPTSDWWRTPGYGDATLLPGGAFDAAELTPLPMLPPGSPLPGAVRSGAGGGTAPAPVPPPSLPPIANMAAYDDLLRRVQGESVGDAPSDQIDMGLVLARIGAAMASSRQPGLLGAFGEGVGSAVQGIERQKVLGQQARLAHQQRQDRLRDRQLATELGVLNAKETATARDEDRGSREAIAWMQANKPDEWEKMLSRAGVDPKSPQAAKLAMDYLARKGQPPTTIIDMKGQTAGSEMMYKKGAEAFDTALNSARLAERNTAIYDRLDEAMNYFKTGSTAALKLKGAQILKDLGVEVNVDAPEGEVARSMARMIELAAAPRGQGQITENERAIIREQIPQLGNTVEGNRRILSMLRKLDDFDKKVADIYIANAEANDGVVNYVQAAKDIRKLGEPLTTSDMAWLKGGKKTTDTPPPSSIPQGAIDLLRSKASDPAAKRQFDEVFGAGAADRVLGGG